jgi:tRNA-specific 2-thiouridylase
MSRILAAMSGGVDSSVAAALLVREGHDVVGAYMKNWINEENIIGHCPWQEDIEDARAVADQLGIEFRVVNLMKEYREKVVKYLLEGYQQGITPNPDVMCNREMKFGVLWEWAKEQDFESIATGHYARKLEGGSESDGSGTQSEIIHHRSSILKGADPNKDQTYFLAMMQPEQVRIARVPSATCSSRNSAISRVSWD